MSNKTFIEVTLDNVTGRDLKSVAIHKCYSEWIVASLRLFGQKYYLDIRQFYGSASKKNPRPVSPSRKGLNMPISKFKNFLEALHALYDAIQAEYPDIALSDDSQEILQRDV